MVASCSATTVTIGEGSYSREVDKDYIAVGIVLLDIFACFVFYLTLLVNQELLQVVDDEIQEGMLASDDFSVVVYQTPYKDNLQLLPGIYYAWAENILEKSALQKDDPLTGQNDNFQDFVLNVNLGLSSYGYLKIFLQIEQILQMKRAKTA